MSRKTLPTLPGLIGPIGPAGTALDSVETRRVNPVYCDDMKMDVEIGGRSKSLHERDGAALGLVDAVIPSHVAIQAEESPDEDGKIRALSETGLDVTERPLKVKDEND